MNKKITLTVLAIILAYLLGVASMSLITKVEAKPPFQYQAYADKGFIQFYENNLRNNLFSEVIGSNNTSALHNLSLELKRSLIGMNARVLHESYSLQSITEEYSPYYAKSLGNEPNKHNLYMHTMYFSRLADWQQEWGYISSAEQQKIVDIKTEWQKYDNVAKELGLTEFKWGTSSHNSEVELINKFNYRAHDDRLLLDDELKQHFSGLTHALNSLNPVFIDFAREVKIKDLHVVEDIINDDLPIIPYYKGRSNKTFISVNSQSNDLIKALRESKFEKVSKPDTIESQPFVLNGGLWQMHFLKQNIVYVIWSREKVIDIHKVNDIGYFKIQEDKYSNLIELINQIINNQ